MKVKFKNNTYGYLEMIFIIFIITSNILSIDCFSQSVLMSNLCKCMELFSYILLFYSLTQQNLYQNHLLFALFLLLPFTLVFLQSKTWVFILGIIIYFSTQKVNFTKIMDISWKVYLCIIVFSFFLYFVGISDGGIARTYSLSRQAKAFGFSHPNVAGYIILMMLLTKIYSDSISKIYKSTFMKVINVMFYCFALLFNYIVFKCRTAVVAFFLALLLIGIFKNVKFKNKILKLSLILIHPFTLVITIFLARMYPNLLTIVLDKFFASRIFLCNYHLMRNGFSMFGKTIDYSVYTLDNSYMSFLLQYGILPSIIYCFLSGAVMIKAWKRKDYRIIAIEIALLAYAYMENGIFNLTTNIAYIFLLVGNGKKQVFEKNKSIEESYDT